MTLKLYELWNAASWVNSWRATYTYDSNGNMTSWLYESWNGTSWVLANSYLIFTDSFGNYYLIYSAEIELYYKTITAVEENETEIMNYSLSQNYPNPFNPRTIISYQLPIANNVTIKVFDVLGKEVATLVDEYRNAGSYEVEFNSVSSVKNPASGVYFYQIKAGDFSETKKMMLLK